MKVVPPMDGLYCLYPISFFMNKEIIKPFAYLTGIVYL